MTEKEEIFDIMYEKYGHYCSWAIWDKSNTNKIKDGMDNIEIIKQNKNNINLKYVLVGLNISKKIENKLSNFHGKNGEVYKLRHAINDTKLKGCYITDIIKSYEEPLSIKMMKYLKQNPDYEKKNIDSFLEELKDLKIKNPTLIAMGNDVYKILNRNKETKEFKIIKITHYAARIEKNKYRKDVKKVIEDL